jgi:hypothetical protein
MVALANCFGPCRGTSATVWWTLVWIVKSSVWAHFCGIVTRTLAPLLGQLRLTRTLQSMVLSLLPLKDQYLWICSDKLFALVCCVWNIFEVASSPEWGAFRYVISRQSSDSIYNVQRTIKPTLSEISLTFLSYPADVHISTWFMIGSCSCLRRAKHKINTTHKQWLVNALDKNGDRLSVHSGI